MADTPEQFQRRVRVRLPIADRYLGSDKEAREAAGDLLQSFRRPILQVKIVEGEAKACKNPPAIDRDGAPRHEVSNEATDWPVA